MSCLAVWFLISYIFKDPLQTAYLKVSFVTLKDSRIVKTFHLYCVNSQMLVVKIDSKQIMTISTFNFNWMDGRTVARSVGRSVARSLGRSVGRSVFLVVLCSVAKHYLVWQKHVTFFLFSFVQFSDKNSCESLSLTCDCILEIAQLVRKCF